MGVGRGLGVVVDRSFANISMRTLSVSMSGSS
jgi:hypothetical protein